MLSSQLDTRLTIWVSEAFNFIERILLKNKFKLRGKTQKKNDTQKWQIQHQVFFYPRMATLQMFSNTNYSINIIWVSMLHGFPIKPWIFLVTHSPSQSAPTILVYQVSLIFFKGLELLKKSPKYWFTFQTCKFWNDKIK